MSNNANRQTAGDVAQGDLVISSLFRDDTASGTEISSVFSAPT
jgi:hypothetical protein